MKRESYHKLRELINEIPFNTLFAQAVIEQRVGSKVYADDEANSKSFYVVIRTECHCFWRSYKHSVQLIFGGSSAE